MSLLSWNCRGLGNLWTVKALEKAIKKEDPIIVFLMETKSSEEWMEKVKNECNMKQSWVVPSNGRSGGLALLWKDEIKIELLTFSLNHIDVLVSDGRGLGRWHLTGFYGNLETAKRSESWAKLKHLKGVAALP